MLSSFLAKIKPFVALSLCFACILTCCDCQSFRPAKRNPKVHSNFRRNLQTPSNTHQLIKSIDDDDGIALCSLKQGITNWPGLNPDCSKSLLAGWDCSLNSTSNSTSNSNTTISPSSSSPLSDYCQWGQVKCTGRSVYQINLERCGLAGTITSEMSRMVNLRYLLLNDNNLEGTIPSAISLMTNIQFLHLYHNLLTGPIPHQLAALPSLQVLYLDNNKLTGPIPSQFSALTLLQYLWLNNNKLTSTIPTELSTLSRLNWLNLNSNEISGSIPYKIVFLENLAYLQLDNNLMTGPAGRYLCSASIAVLTLQNNSFSCIATCATNLAEFDGNQNYDLETNITDTCGDELIPTTVPTYAPSASPTMAPSPLPSLLPTSHPSASPTCSSKYCGPIPPYKLPWGAVAGISVFVLCLAVVASLYFYVKCYTNKGFKGLCARDQHRSKFVNYSPISYSIAKSERGRKSSLNPKLARSDVSGSPSTSPRSVRFNLPRRKEESSSNSKRDVSSDSPIRIKKPMDSDNDDSINQIKMKGINIKPILQEDPNFKQIKLADRIIKISGKYAFDEETKEIDETATANSTYTDTPIKDDAETNDDYNSSNSNTVDTSERKSHGVEFSSHQNYQSSSILNNNPNHSDSLPPVISTKQKQLNRYNGQTSDKPADFIGDASPISYIGNGYGNVGASASASGGGGNGSSIHNIGFDYNRLNNSRSRDEIPLPLPSAASPSPKVFRYPDNFAPNGDYNETKWFPNTASFLGSGGIVDSKKAAVNRMSSTALSSVLKFKFSGSISSPSSLKSNRSSSNSSNSSSNSSNRNYSTSNNSNNQISDDRPPPSVQHPSTDTRGLTYSLSNERNSENPIVKSSNNNNNNTTGNDFRKSMESMLSNFTEIETKTDNKATFDYLETGSEAALQMSRGNNRFFDFSDTNSRGNSNSKPNESRDLNSLTPKNTIIAMNDNEFDHHNKNRDDDDDDDDDLSNPASIIKAINLRHNMTRGSPATSTNIFKNPRQLLNSNRGSFIDFDDTNGKDNSNSRNGSTVGRRKKGDPIVNSGTNQLQNQPFNGRGNADNSLYAHVQPQLHSNSIVSSKPSHQGGISPSVSSVDNASLMPMPVKVDPSKVQLAAALLAKIDRTSGTSTSTNTLSKQTTSGNNNNTASGFDRESDTRTDISSPKPLTSYLINTNVSRGSNNQGEMLRNHSPHSLHKVGMKDISKVMLSTERSDFSNHISPRSESPFTSQTSISYAEKRAVATASPSPGRRSATTSIRTVISTSNGASISSASKQTSAISSFVAGRHKTAAKANTSKGSDDDKSMKNRYSNNYSSFSTNTKEGSRGGRAEIGAAD